MHTIYTYLDNYKVLDKYKTVYHNIRMTHLNVNIISEVLSLPL